MVQIDSIETEIINLLIFGFDFTENTILTKGNIDINHILIIKHLQHVLIYQSHTFFRNPYAIAPKEPHPNNHHNERNRTT